ncbi:zinc finger protein 664-like [Diorhabda sublineata]|uniref:zinc finger protein 664-like n=1 Tax=Diorhabda sublineata TaxID=1163346 RepID=UPI0024E063F3|nr:zinc finger protein 664-like [Diorhabda sublineata]
MDIENIKKEIDVYDDFLSNIDVKQKFIGEVFTLKNQNMNRKIDQPVLHGVTANLLLDTVKIFDNVDAANKTKKSISKSHKKRTKSKGLLGNRKYTKSNTIAGIMICVYCGNLYTNRVEFLCHISTNHCIKQNKTKFHHKNESDNSIFDIKDEIGIVEDELKVEETTDVTDNLNSRVHEVSKSFEEEINTNKHSHINTGEKQFKCDICLKSFFHKSRLNVHIRYHTGEKPFKCDICLQTFSQKYYLKSHSRRHTGEKPFKCNVCLKAFSQKSGLIAHSRIHTGEKPFKCGFCIKSFQYKNNLNNHLSVHTGEKPFKCDICLKTFLQKSSLKKHLRIHTGEKPFKCDICFNTFTRKTSLIAHSRIHTGEKPYKCDICMKSFTQKGHLNSHSLSHTREKLFKCNICLKSFVYKCSLNKHLLKTHKIKTM